MFHRSTTSFSGFAQCGRRPPADHRWRVPVALVGLVATTALAAGCGFRDEERGSSPTGTLVSAGRPPGGTAPAERARDGDRARLALLTTADVEDEGGAPPGTEGDGGGAAGADAPEGVAAGRCEALDPVLEAAFRLTEDVPAARSEALVGRPEARQRIQHDVTVLPSTADAETVLAAERTPAFAECVRLVAGDEARRAGTPAGDDGGTSDEAAPGTVTVAPGPSLGAGDETASLVATVTGPEGRTTHVLVSIVRVDRALSTVTVYAEDEPDPAAVDVLVHRATDRLTTVLDAP